MLSINLNASTEALDWGNSSKLPERIAQTLSNHMNLFTDRSFDRHASVKMCKDLTKVVKDELGLTIEFECGNGGLDAYAVSPGPRDVKAFTAVAEVLGKDVSSLKTLDPKPTLVNERTGKVSGPFTELPFYIFFTRNWISGLELTTMELTSILIHEIGHCRGVYENMTLVGTAAMAFRHHMDEYTNANTLDERVIILEDLRTGHTKQELILAAETDLKVNSTIAAQAIMVERQREIMEETLGRRHRYSNRGEEQQADDFVARMGLSNEFVSALTKSELDPSSDYSVKKRANAGLKNSILASLAIMVFFSIPLWWFGVVFVYLVTAKNIFYEMTKEWEHSNHDPTTVRLQRLLNNQIASIKQSETNGKDRSRLIIQYNEMLAEVTKYRRERGLDENEDRVYRNILPFLRASGKFSKAMYQLETLVNNKIHVLDARLGGIK